MTRDYSTLTSEKLIRRKRTVTITRVRRQTLTVANSVLVWCPVCNREVETVSSTDAALMLRLAGRMLESAVTAGRIHMIEAPSVSPRVCKDSLLIE